MDVFHASGADTWASSSTPAATLTKAGGAGNDALGALVAVSADGTTAVVSAPGARKGKGAAYVFNTSMEAAWKSSTTPTATLTDAAGTNTDFWGGADVMGSPELGISADGATVLVGAPGTNWNTGAADVFHTSEFMAPEFDPHREADELSVASARLRGSPARRTALVLGERRPRDFLSEVPARESEEGSGQDQEVARARRLAESRSREAPPSRHEDQPQGREVAGLPPNFPKRVQPSRAKKS